MKNKPKNQWLAIGAMAIVVLIASTIASVATANKSNANRDFMQMMMDDDMNMMGMMKHMNGMVSMHNDMRESMRKSLDETKDPEERELLQELMEHMESCPMMK